MEMYGVAVDYRRVHAVGAAKADTASTDLSTLYAWRAAVLHGRLSEAAALRNYVESFEDEVSAADAEWQ